MCLFLFNSIKMREYLVGKFPWKYLQYLPIDLYDFTKWHQRKIKSNIWLYLSAFYKTSWRINNGKYQKSSKVFKKKKKKKKKVGTKLFFIIAKSSKRKRNKKLKLALKEVINFSSVLAFGWVTCTFLECVFYIWVYLGLNNTVKCQ